MNWKTADLVTFIQTEFGRLADDEKAGPMAAYMKTDMPFYGIQKPERIPIYKEMKKLFVPQSHDQYEMGIESLWQLPHREEKYAAIEFAKQHQQFVNTKSIPLYGKLIVDGAWWDLVDDIAVALVSEAYLRERDAIETIMEEWIDHENMWLRRTAILSHNHHKQQTNWKQLSDHCLRRASEKEFFIRKAIGWALREYSYANPSAVKQFLLAHQDQLSNLSFKEGAKQLVRTGQFRL